MPKGNQRKITTTQVPNSAEQTEITLTQGDLLVFYQHLHQQYPASIPKAPPGSSISSFPDWQKNQNIVVGAQSPQLLSFWKFVAEQKVPVNTMGKHLTAFRKRIAEYIPQQQNQPQAAAVSSPSEPVATTQPIQEIKPQPFSPAETPSPAVQPLQNKAGLNDSQGSFVDLANVDGSLLESSDDGLIVPEMVGDFFVRWDDDLVVIGDELNSPSSSSPPSPDPTAVQLPPSALVHTGEELSKQDGQRAKGWGEYLGLW